MLFVRLCVRQISCPVIQVVYDEAPLILELGPCGIKAAAKSAARLHRIVMRKERDSTQMQGTSDSIKKPNGADISQVMHDWYLFRGNAILAAPHAQ